MSQSITIVKTVAELRERIEPHRDKGKRVGLVPTMGALHEGHLSLVRRSVEMCDCSVVTIFVNPTQFAPDEDLEKYPRTLEQDVCLIAKMGADLIFVPDANEIYPDRGSGSTTVNPPELASRLEGEFRSAHFGGVCTLVLKLFNMAMPDIAFFGQKDFQQACVVKTMVSDLNIPVEVSICPIVRDPDGLALSSRNRYLNAEQRQIALCLNQTLQYAQAEITGGQNDAHCLMAEMRQKLIDGGVTSVDYASICDPDSLSVLETIQTPVVVLLAANVGATRLIDNCLIE